MIPLILKNSKTPLHEQVYNFYRNGISDNTIKKGYRMPSHRLLAKELGLSNNTVIRAYQQLTHEGYVKSEERKGLFVCELENWGINKNWGRSQKEIGKPGSKAIFPEKGSASPEKKSKPVLNLRGGVVDEKVFPLKEWRKMQQLAMDRLFFQYDYQSRQSTLKENLVKYLYYSRGVVATKDRIVVGAGMNVLFSLLALMLKTTHKKILFEEPGYPKARTIFQLHDFKVKPLKVKETGIDLSLLQKEKADLIYLTPSHQYPTGSVIPIGNRLKILNWAKVNKAYIIEDDSECEFQHKGRLIPALQGIDNFNSVIYFGSFSNAIMPSLRIAYMVLPETFPTALQPFEFLMNTVPFIAQQTVACFMEKGYWEPHLRKMRKLYREKYFTSLNSLKNIFGNKISFTQNYSGLNILLQVKTSQTEKQLMDKAESRGIIVTPTRSFYADSKNLPAFPEILFELGSLSLEQIPEVIESLNKAWFP